jgi:hypothetical protein
MTTYKVKAIRRSTQDELAAHTRLKDIAANQLPVVRQAAERWRTGAGLSGGAVAVAGIIAAPEVLREATDRQLVQGLIVLTVTMVVALVAVGLGLRASIGWPALRNIASAEALRDWELGEVRTSLRCLRWSMYLTVLTIALAAVAGAVLLFGFDLCTLQIPAGPPDK